MKIEIESDILGTEKEISEINYIIHLAKEHSNLNDFSKDIAQTDFSTLEIGYGSSHCWVKQYAEIRDADDTPKWELRNERLLFIH